MEEVAIYFEYRGRKLKYTLFPSDKESQKNQEGEGLGEAEIAGLTIAGRFFRLGKKVANPEKCLRCGKCCLSIGKSIQASPSDVQRWLDEGREEVLQHLEMKEEDGTLTTDGNLYLGDELGRCIFLISSGEKHACSIHSTRPEVCREYPLNIGGVCKNGVDFRD